MEDEFRVIFEELDSEENLSRPVVTTQVVDVKRMPSIIISIKFGEDCVRNEGAWTREAVHFPRLDV